MCSQDPCLRTKGTSHSLVFLHSAVHTRKTLLADFALTCRLQIAFWVIKSFVAMYVCMCLSVRHCKLSTRSGGPGGCCGAVLNSAVFYYLHDIPSRFFEARVLFFILFQFANCLFSAINRLNEHPAPC